MLNADGYFGWQEHAPYDAIIVTAAPDHLPQPLISQLRDGGRLIVPIGPQGAVQTLWLFEKKRRRRAGVQPGRGRVRAAHRIGALASTGGTQSLEMPSAPLALTCASAPTPATAQPPRRHTIPPRSARPP